MTNKRNCRQIIKMIESIDKSKDTLNTSISTSLSLFHFTVNNELYNGLYNLYNNCILLQKALLCFIIFHLRLLHAICLKLITYSYILKLKLNEAKSRIYIVHHFYLNFFYQNYYT